MWTYNITKKTKTDENTIELVVQFDNGTNTFKRTYYVTRGNATRMWLENQIVNDVSEYENKKTFNTDIKEGAFTLTATPTVTPTQEELDKAEFIEKTRILSQMTKLVQLGVIDATELTTIKNRVITLYRKEWVKDLSI